MRKRRHHLAACERLEDRFMLATFSTGSWGWSGTLGAGSAVTAMATDSSGNVVVAGTFSGTCDVDPGPNVTSLTSAGDSDVFLAKYGPSGQLLWAKRFGGTGADRAFSVAVDARDDSIVVGGAYSGVVDFDPGAGTQSRTSVGYFDAFMSKFASDGAFQWVGTVGSNRAPTFGNSEALEHIQGIDIDASGTIYATGMFNGAATVSFGTGTASLSAGGPQNTCILQVNAAGNLVWAKQFTSTFLNAGLGITVMPTGRVAVRGFLHTDQTDFDPGPGTAYGQPKGLSDAYLAVLESNGTYVWSTVFGTSSEDGPAGLAVDASGAIYLVGLFGGRFGGTIDLDPGTGVASFTSAGDGDVFIVKLSAAGSYVWGQRIGGTGLDQAFASRLTAQGKLVICGFFNGTADFDPGAGQQLLTSAGGNDGFVLTLNPADGSFGSVRRYGGTGNDTVDVGGIWAGSLAFGPAGQGYVSGATTGLVDFSQGAGGVAVGSTTGTSGFLWQFEDLNVTPTAVSLTGTSVAENQPSGTVVGTLATTDPDAGDTFTYSLVSGTGSTDNGSFLIVGNQLRTAASFDYETKSSYSIRVRSTDAGGLFTEKVFTILVTDVNEAPTAVSLSPAARSLPDSTSTAERFKLADITVTDDGLGTNSLSLSGPDAGSFEIIGTELFLRAGVRLDGLSKPGYAVTVEASDATLPGSLQSALFTLSVVTSGIEVADGQSVADTTVRSGDFRLVKRGLGTLILDLANSHSGGTVVEAGEVIIRNPLALGSGGVVVQAGAKLTLDTAGQQVLMNGLRLDTTSTLDLGTSSVLITDETYLDNSGIISRIARGGDKLTGIISSSIEPGSFREIGYQILPDGFLEVGYSAVGDANMDGSVNVQDLIAISTSGKYGSGLADAGWWQGDFNHDGVVNVTDLINLSTSGLYGTGSYMPVTAARAMSQQPSDSSLGSSLAGLTTTPTGYTAQTGLEPAATPSAIESADQMAATATSPIQVSGREGVGRLAWAAIANQDMLEEPKDAKAARWRLVAR